MGVMDKILNVMRLEPEDEYEYDNENYEDVNFDFLSQTEQHDLLEHIICNIMK